MLSSTCAIWATYHLDKNNELSRCVTEINTRKRVANKTYLHPKDGLKNSFECSVSHTACLKSNRSKVGILRDFREPYTERS